MGDHKGPRAEEEVPGPVPHRCNARIEDCIQSLFVEDGFSKARKAFWAAMRCMRSEPGQEPQEPFQTITDPEKYNAPMKRKQRPTFTLPSDRESKNTT